MHATKLTGQEIAAQVKKLKGWTVEGGKLHRVFEFRDFGQAFGFMARVALAAEARIAVEIVLGTAPWLVLAGLVEGFITPRGLGLGPVIVIGASLGAVYWALVLWRGRPARDDAYLEVAEPRSGAQHAATPAPVPSP